MDLLQLIEGRRFLGREFLVWLWFESELFEAQMGSSGTDDFELWLEKNITLEAGKKDKEQSKLKGMQPSASPEAREALRQGKLPTQAAIRIKRGELEYSFTFTSDKLSLSGVKIPQLMKEQDDDPFYDRMGHIEDLEAMIEGLYADFLVLRVSSGWQGFVMPAILRWVRDEEGTDVTAYRSARMAALAAGRGKPSKGKPSKGDKAQHSAALPQGSTQPRAAPPPTRGRCCFMRPPCSIARMAAELTRDEVVSVVDRILRGIIVGEEADAWLTLAERSLRLPAGSLVGRVYYPEESGISPDASAEELVETALIER